MTQLDPVVNGNQLALVETILQAYPHPAALIHARGYLLAVNNAWAAAFPHVTPRSGAPALTLAAIADRLLAHPTRDMHYFQHPAAPDAPHLDLRSEQIPHATLYTTPLQHRQLTATVVVLQPTPPTSAPTTPAARPTEGSSITVDWTGVLQTLVATLHLSTTDEVIVALEKLLGTLVPYDCLFLYRADAQGTDLRLTANTGTDLERCAQPPQRTLRRTDAEVQHICQARRGVIWNNRPVPTTDQTEHWLAVPLTSESRLVGLLYLLRTSDPPFVRTDRQRAALVSDYVAHALHLSNQQAINRRYARELNLLTEVRRLIDTATSTDAMLQAVVEATVNILGYAHVGIHLRYGDVLVLQHQIGYNYITDHIPIDSGITGRVVQTGAPVFLPDAQQDPDFIGLTETRSEICVPLTDHEQVVGVLNVETIGEESLTHDDVQLITLLGSQVSAALTRVRLYEQLGEREAQYRTLIHTVQDIIFQTDAAGRITYVNPAWQSITGIATQSLVGQSMVTLLHPDDRATAQHMCALMLHDQQPSCHCEVRLRVHDGSYRWFEVVAWTRYHSDSTVAGLTGTMKDITHRIEMLNELQISEHRFRSLLENMTDIILIITAEGHIKYATPSFERALGHTLHSLHNDTLLTLIHPDEYDHLHATVRRLQAGEAQQTRGEYRIRHSNGTWLYFETVATSLLDDPAIEGIVLNCHDVTARREAAESLQYHAMHDSLTGLPNRDFFMLRLEVALERTRKLDGSFFALLFLDLDNFKLVNDSLGHLAGDMYLQHIAACLRASVRSHDFLARLGGDEFTILLDPVHSPEEVTRIADTIQTTLAEPFYLEGHRMSATTSIGILLHAPEYDDIQDLLRDADIAMYHAKANGKARYTIFEATMHTRAMRRLTMQTELLSASEREEFRLLYQPIVSLDDGRIIGVEALIRWQHPQYGELSHSDFGAVAEESGLIVRVGQWVLLNAARQITAWQSQFDVPSLALHVNLSSREFQQPDLVEYLDSVIASTGIDHQLLRLEIAESTMLDKVNLSRQTLARLQSRSIQVCIDHFGSDVASLRYLYDLPVSILKIDSHFINRIAIDPRTLNLVRTFASLARALGLGLFAEGVETSEQEDHIRAIGCKAAQGFRYCTPLPADQITYLLQQQHQSTRTPPEQSSTPHLHSPVPRTTPIKRERND